MHCMRLLSLDCIIVLKKHCAAHLAAEVYRLKQPSCFCSVTFLGGGGGGGGGGLLLGDYSKM